jgi:hypothetical protein
MQSIKELLPVIGGFIRDVFTFPAVLLAAVLLFKKPIGGFINSVSLFSLKFGNVTVSITREFQTKVEIIAGGLNSCKTGTPSAAAARESAKEPYGQPQIEIPRAFMLIETALYETTRRINIRIDDISDIAAELYSTKKLDTDIFIYITSMMQLKDKIISVNAENIDISEKAVTTYRQNAERIAGIINAIE